MVYITFFLFFFLVNTTTLTITALYLKTKNYTLKEKLNYLLVSTSLSLMMTIIFFIIRETTIN